jgi:hypothetical protein
MDELVLALKVVAALAAAVILYYVGSRLIRTFATTPPPADPDPADLEPVDYRFRCEVCGTEVTMTAAPTAEVPTPPRHCMEEMSLVVEE